jgi:hypothetical protein
MIKFTDQKRSRSSVQLLINYFQENVCLKGLCICVYIRVNHIFHENLKIISVFPGIFGIVRGISKCLCTYSKAPHGTPNDILWIHGWDTLCYILVFGRWREQFFSETPTLINHTTQLRIPEYPHINNHHRIVQNAYNIKSTVRVLEPPPLMLNIIQILSRIFSDKT